MGPWAQALSLLFLIDKLLLVYNYLLMFFCSFTFPQFYIFDNQIYLGNDI